MITAKDIRRSHSVEMRISNNQSYYMMRDILALDGRVNNANPFVRNLNAQYIKRLDSRLFIRDDGLEPLVEIINEAPRKSYKK